MGDNRNRSEVERQTERDVMPIEKIQETMQKHKGLKLVDVKCNIVYLFILLTSYVRIKPTSFNM